MKEIQPMFAEDAQFIAVDIGDGSDLGEGFIKSWSFLSVPTYNIASINKTTAVWASQGQTRVYYGYPRYDFKKFPL